MKPTFKMCLQIAMILISGQTAANAGDGIVIKDASERTALMQRAHTWLHPDWISKDFKFDDKLDVFIGPQPTRIEQSFLTNALTCIVNEEALSKPMSGASPKFYCETQVSPKHGQTELMRIKVKYDADWGEMYGDTLGSRLMWALGFASDRMFFIPQTLCYGCTANPKTDRRIDPNTLDIPRIFQPTAVETKFAAEEISFANPPFDPDSETQVRHYPEHGFTFSELMNTMSPDVKIRETQLAERDGLRLLAIFLQHADNKAENQRIVCMGEEKNGTCKGDVVMMIQDIGISFGQGTALKWDFLDTTNLNHWSAKPVWSDPANCVGTLGLSYDINLTLFPKFSEKGRVFLSKLLKGFSEGPAGRKRLIDLFRIVHIQDRGGTAEQWADAFIARAKQIEFPMGENHPEFHCPQ